MIISDERMLPKIQQSNSQKPKLQNEQAIELSAHQNLIKRMLEEQNKMP
jgi:hypothetical protein